MLTGLVSKNAILLVDYTNTLRKEEGLSAREALRLAGPVRLRPILMTSATLIASMMPILLGTGPGAEMRSPVAAVLVASIKLHCLDTRLNLRYRGPNVIPCNADFRKGEEMGWFEHGSTILMFAPRGYELCEDIGEGTRILVGQRLMTATVTKP